MKKIFAHPEALDRRLMIEARRRLLFTGQSVGEISLELGYEEHSYFTRVFRKRHGVTPRQFRASVGAQGGVNRLPKSPRISS